MVNPKISIIVPVYNVAKYLPTCIDSIIEQSLEEWELILINDGSSDESGRICDEYRQRDSRIRVIHKENGGVSSARNLGLDNALAKWITFVDSDDYLLPKFIEGLYKPLQLGEDVDFVQGGCCSVVNGIVVGVNQSYEYSVNERADSIFNSFRGLVVSKLFNKDIINNWSHNSPLRFDEKMRIAEDMAFTLDYLLKVQRYAFVSETGYCYRIDNMTSATHTFVNRRFDECISSFRHIHNSVRAYMKKNGLTEEQSMFRLSQCCEHLQNACMSIYYSQYNRNKRIEILKNEFNVEELKMLNYSRSSLFKKCIFNMLKNGNVVLFDICCFIYIKLIRRH